MKALDTNMLVRFLVNDDKKQASKARQILEEAEGTDERLLVVTPVVLELIWVLSFVYGYDRGDIVEAIEVLLQMSVIRFEHPERVRKLALMARSSSVDISDLLIAICGRDLGSTATMTFDKGAATSPLFELVHA